MPLSISRELFWTTLSAIVFILEYFCPVNSQFGLKDMYKMNREFRIESPQLVVVLKVDFIIKMDVVPEIRLELVQNTVYRQQSQ